MIANKQPNRAFTAFLVTWAFLVLTVTGLVLYVVPQGRVANWTQWSLLGLDKESWGDVHILFGVVFIIGGAVHLYFNWKAFRTYLATRVRGHLALKRELVTSLGATVLLMGAAIAAIPPVSWLFDLNESIKGSWAGAPGREPPFGHAEEVALPALARRADFDLAAAHKALLDAGIRVEDERATLLRIARDNGTTPAALYALIPRGRSAPATDTTVATNAPAAGPDPVEIEERLAGSGIGGKTLAAFAAEQGRDLAAAVGRLASVGIHASPEEKLKAIAEDAGSRPIEIAKAVLIEGYRPQPAQ